MLLTSVLLGISVILVAHTRLYVEAPVNIFQTLKSQVLSEICSFLVKKNEKAGNRSYNYLSMFYSFTAYKI
jgi:hypothetical protein